MYRYKQIPLVLQSLPQTRSHRRTQSPLLCVPLMHCTSLVAFGVSCFMLHYVVRLLRCRLLEGSDDVLFTSTSQRHLAFSFSHSRHLLSAHTTESNMLTTQRQLLNNNRTTCKIPVEASFHLEKILDDPWGKGVSKGRWGECTQKDLMVSGKYTCAD